MRLSRGGVLNRTFEERHLATSLNGAKLYVNTMSIDILVISFKNPTSQGQKTKWRPKSPKRIVTSVTVGPQAPNMHLSQKRKIVTNPKIGK